MPPVATDTQLVTVMPAAWSFHQHLKCPGPLWYFWDGTRACNAYGNAPTQKHLCGYWGKGPCWRCVMSQQQAGRESIPSVHTGAVLSCQPGCCGSSHVIQGSQGNSTFLWHWGLCHYFLFLGLLSESLGVWMKDITETVVTGPLIMFFHVPQYILRPRPSPGGFPVVTQLDHPTVMSAPSGHCHQTGPHVTVLRIEENSISIHPWVSLLYKLIPNLQRESLAGVRWFYCK